MTQYVNWIAFHRANQMPVAQIPTTQEVVNRIAKLTEAMMDYWKTPKQWQTVEEQGFLSKAMLDWQVSLSYALRNWVDVEQDKAYEGNLILAWANLGALVENAFKLFLSFHFRHVKKDPVFIDLDNNANRMKNPDNKGFALLIEFCRQKDALDPKFCTWADEIRKRRNAIHAFTYRDIKTFTQFNDDLRTYLSFLREINSRHDYSDGDVDFYEIEIEDFLY